MALGNKRISSQEPNISMTKQAFHSFYGKDHLISSSIQLVLDEGESNQQKLPSSSNSKCNNFVFGSTKNPTLEKEAQSILSFNNGADNCRLQSYNGKAALDDDGFPTWDDVTDHDGFTICLTIRLLQEANSFETLKNNIKCQFGDPGAEVELFLPKDPILIDYVEKEILSRMIRNEHKNDGIQPQFFWVSQQKKNKNKRQTGSKATQCDSSNSNNEKCLYLEKNLQASKRHCLGTCGQPKVRKSMQTKDPQIVAAKRIEAAERISERLKALQELIPNGSKVD